MNLKVDDRDKTKYTHRMNKVLKKLLILLNWVVPIFGSCIEWLFVNHVCPESNEWQRWLSSKQTRLFVGRGFHFHFQSEKATSQEIRKKSWIHGSLKKRFEIWLERNSWKMNPSNSLWRSDNDFPMENGDFSIKH